MDNQHLPEQHTVSSHVVELVVAAVLMLIAGVVIADSLRIGVSWGDSGPQAGFFPFYIGLILLAASTLIFISQLFGRNQRLATFVGRDSLVHVSQVFVPTVIYVASIAWLGIYVASAIYLALFMRFVGKFALYKAVPLAIAVSAVLFWMFEMAFLVPLPKGPLEHALGY